MAKLCVLQILGDYTPPGQVPSPPGIWGGGNEPFPTPPIHMPGPPVGIWPSPGYPAHPIAPGGPPPIPTHPIYYPPGIWPSPGYPAHPIAPGGQPPGIWGGGNQPFPTPPINLPQPPIDVTPPDHPPVDPQGKWVWLPGLGWVWVPGSEDLQPHK